MLKIVPSLTLIFSMLFFLNCKKSSNFIETPQAIVEMNYGLSIPYDLSNPHNVFSLERDLKEISGLTFSPTFNNLLAINDEKGYIYLLDPSTAKIQGRIDFGKSNDYEGIASNNGMIYIVESNGDIAITDEESSKKIDSYKTKLSRKNDIEGLAYNIETSTFLVAAKGNGSIKGKTGKKKAIFSLDPKSQSVSEIPYFTVDLQEAVQELNNPKISGSSMLSNYEMVRINRFSPSGIAVHPITNNIYVLSSRGKLLVIFDQKGNLEGIHFLDAKLHTQPEGICFGPDYTLYISNEGRAKKANIVSFTYKE